MSLQAVFGLQARGLTPLGYTIFLYNVLLLALWDFVNNIFLFTLSITFKMDLYHIPHSGFSFSN